MQAMRLSGMPSAPRASVSRDGANQPGPLDAVTTRQALPYEQHR
ncbi:hypothetical protein ACF1G0_33210 [Streptomyces sp. NPDC013953]